MSSSKGCERGVRRWVVEGCGRLDSPTSIEGDLNCRNQVGISRDEHGDVVAVVSGAQSEVEGIVPPRAPSSRSVSGGSRSERVTGSGSVLGAPGVRPSVSGLAGGAPRLRLHQGRRGAPLRKPLVGRSLRVVRPTLPQ